MGDFAAVVMAAGLGTRMKSGTPKHLHPLLGRRLVDWVLAAVEPLRPDPLVLVVAPDAVDAFDGMDVAVQDEPLGTGDSLRAAREKAGDAKELLVVSGDHPRLSPQLLQKLVEEHRTSGATATVLSFEPSDARAYGRIVRDGDGRLEQIVEYADVDESRRAIREVNSSIYVFAADKLWPALDRIQPVNAQGELYLTDAVRLLVEAGEVVAVFKAPDADAGEAKIGEATNVAAGNSTANSPHPPGRHKGRTKIGRNVRTGIHNGFEAPVEIGDDAWIAGGAYITEDVPPESLAGFPPKQITKEGYLRGKRND